MHGKSELGFWAAVVAVSLCMVPVTLADCEPQWITPAGGIPGVDGAVCAVTSWDPDGAGPEPELLIMGGGFQVAGAIEAKDIVGWDGERWLPLGDGIEIACVYALAEYDGSLIAGGFISKAGGLACNNIARCDGSQWWTLGGGINGEVKALAVYNGELIAGGRFDNAGGVPCGNIARWDGQHWAPVGGGMSTGYYDNVSALTVHDGKLIACGYFQEAGGSSCNNIASWDGQEWQPLGDGVQCASGHAPARGLASFRGDLIVGGSLDTAGGRPCNSVARWDGSTWHPLGSGVGTTPWTLIHALHVLGNQLFVGGLNVDSAGGVVCNGVARWDGVEWHALDTGLALSPLVYAICDHQGDLFVGGDYFSRAGEVACSHVARWDGSQWHALETGPTYFFYYDLLDMTSYGGDLFVTGYFPYINNLECNGIARWDGTEWCSVGGGVGHASYRTPCVRSVVPFKGDLVAGGYFDSAGGVPCNKVARWDGAEWNPLGDPGRDYVLHIAALGDEVIIIQDNGRNVHAQAWNGESWRSIGGFGDGQSRPEYWDITVFQGELIVAGCFAGVTGALDCRNIAAWDGSAWHSLGNGLPGPLGETWASALTVYDGNLVVGGQFTRAGQVSCNNLAGWNGQEWFAIANDLDGGVCALTVYDDHLIAAGRFDNVGGLTVNKIAAWDGQTWSALGEGLNDRARRLASYNGRLHAIGKFSLAGGHGCSQWARWGCPYNIGDMNCDAEIDFGDINPFVLAMSNPAGYAVAFPECDVDLADINRDGNVDFGDINPFVRLLTGP